MGRLGGGGVWGLIGLIRSLDVCMYVYIILFGGCFEVKDKANGARKEGSIGRAVDWGRSLFLFLFFLGLLSMAYCGYCCHHIKFGVNVLSITYVSGHNRLSLPVIGRKK